MAHKVILTSILISVSANQLKMQKTAETNGIPCHSKQKETLLRTCLDFKVNHLKFMTHG